MNLRNSLLLLLLIITVSCKNEPKKVDTQSSYLIDIDVFKEISNTSNIKIIDFRKPHLYVKGHIKGAINIWRTDIEDASYPYGGMMAPKEQIEKLFSKLGIQTTDTLILYDDNGLCDSSRLWWILQNYNFTNVKLLNGGIESWRAIEGSLTNEVPVLEPTLFKLPKESSYKYHISKEQMFSGVLGDVTILDTRSTDEFSGKYQKKGAFKGGRIPRSQLIDWAHAIDYNGTRKIKSVKELSDIYKGLTSSKNDTIIVYCHSGVRSAHTTFVLTQLLGYKNVLNYDGSWTEWSYFDNLPFEKDSLTTKK